MNESARQFDLPVDSPEHQLLADTVWMGGPLVAVRYYLGRLIGRNLFRDSQVDVEDLLVAYISKTTSPEAGDLMRGGDGWTFAEEFLRHRFEQERGKPSYRARTLPRKAMMAVELYMKNPSISMSQLATEVRTTEKQLSRNSLLSQCLWLKKRRPEDPNPPEPH